LNESSEMSKTDPLSRATTFLWTHARVVEQRSFAHVFLAAPPVGAVDAIRAYRNPDGGFGHGMEPDLCAPTSQPIHTDTALAMRVALGVPDATEAAGVCTFLSGVADTRGAIPYALPDAAAYPRAAHWNGAFAFEPSLHATSGLSARLHASGAGHAWLDQATAWCFEQIAGQPAYSGHSILNTLAFLTHAPDRERAGALWPHVTQRLFEADYVMLDPAFEGYGLTPLTFAPTPDSAARTLFADAVIDAHLARLQDQQQEDGGWPISWTPPGPAAVEAWRGRFTLEALQVLRAYGRL